MTITLESIKAEQGKLSAMIARFEEEANKPAFFEYQGERINLSHGERYIGTVIAADRAHHIILLPGQKTGINWKDAMAWAKESGGDLPNRVESALLFATMNEEFEKEAYWTCETGSDDAWAWYQLFTSGGQYYHHEGTALRARAVRRLVLE